MLKEAITLAKTSDGKSRHAAIITNKRGRVIASSINSYSCTHPKQYHYAKRQGKPKAVYLHAELKAIIRSKGEGHTIYVGRVLKNGHPGMSKPCPICMDAIRNETNIKRIVYSISKEEYGVMEIER